MVDANSVATLTTEQVESMERTALQVAEDLELDVDRLARMIRPVDIDGVRTHYLNRMRQCLFDLMGELDKSGQVVDIIEVSGDGLKKYAIRRRGVSH